jgi:hypothetical protein
MRHFTDKHRERYDIAIRSRDRSQNCHTGWQFCVLETVDAGGNCDCVSCAHMFYRCAVRGCLAKRMPRAEEFPLPVRSWRQGAGS